MKTKDIICIKVGSEDYPTNCYIIKDSNKNAIVIDPGYDTEKIIKTINDNNLILRKILLTHTHADHIGELENLLNAYDCNVMVHKNDVDGFTDDDKAYFSMLGIMKINVPKDRIEYFEDKDVINVGSISLEVIHTPGHTSGCVCFFEKEMNILITGDTLFSTCYGRCDLKSSSIAQMEKSLYMLFERFSNVMIYPGHEDSINISDIEKKIKLLITLRR